MTTEIEGDGIIIVTLPDGTTQTVPALEGWRVMEILRDAGMPLLAECGGACSCATCHVHVAPVWQDKVGDPTLEEEDLLDTLEDLDEHASRLSCQILYHKALDGLEVLLPQETVRKSQQENQ